MRPVVQVHEAPTLEVKRWVASTARSAYIYICDTCGTCYIWGWPAVKTLDTAAIPAGDIDRIEEYARTSVSPEMRDLIFSLTESARQGEELTLLEQNDVLSPSDAARRLGMSRTHLYKLLDKGSIPFHRVGRDRRIYWKDLLTFQKQRQDGKRELAERFAHHDSVRQSAVDRLADRL